MEYFKLIYIAINFFCLSFFISNLVFLSRKEYRSRNKKYFFKSKKSFNKILTLLMFLIVFGWLLLFSNNINDYEILFLSGTMLNYIFIYLGTISYEHAIYNLNSMEIEKIMNKNGYELLPLKNERTFKNVNGEVVKVEVVTNLKNGNITELNLIKKEKVIIS